MRIFFIVCALLIKAQLMASDLFREHKLSEEAFQEKTREVYQAGLAVINEESTSSAQHKIPLMTHTFLSTKKTAGAALLSEDQKQWFATSIDALPEWQHILWVTEDPTSISPEDLGNLAGRVEVRAIDAFSLPCVAEINKLLEFGLNKHASAMFRYAVLAKQGGVVRDLDTEIMQDLTPLNSMFGFYADTNSANKIDSRFIGSKAGHQIIRQALKLVQAHVNRAETKDALMADYQARYASDPLSVSFHEWGAAGQDMIFNSTTGNNCLSEARIIYHTRAGFSLSAEAIEASTMLDSTSLEVLNLYKKYYMDGDYYTNEEILQDFISQPSGVTEEKRAEEIIFTLTSYPARFATTWLAIESLLRQQTERPDRVNLNLFEGEFPDRVLPWFIQQQMKRGLEINWCAENLKVYLKIIPAILKFPEASVIAVDDDVYYPSDKLSILLDGHRQYPDSIICSDGRIVRTTENYILPVNTWNFTGWHPSSSAREPNTDIIPEGVFGVLIPPRAWNADLFTRKDLFFKLCPSDDDLWTYLMTVVSGKKIAKTQRILQSLVNIDGTQEVESSLWKTNFANESAVLTESFAKTYEHFNLSSYFEGKICCPNWEGIKKSNITALTYNREQPFTQLRIDPNAPMDLVRSFGGTEEAAIWTLDESSDFRVYADNPEAFYRVTLKGQPFIDHNKGYSRIKIFKKDKDKEDELIASYALREESNISFLTQINQQSEIFELQTPDATKPSSVSDSSDFRQLGIYFSKFGVYKIIPEILDIDLGNNFDLRTPLHLGNGFYHMEKTGLWSSNSAEFSFVFSEINKPYKFNIYCERTFLESGSCEVFQNDSVLVHSEFTKENPLNVLRFNYIPTEKLTKFSLKMNTGNPKTLGHSEDDRELGMFITRIAVQ